MTPTANLHSSFCYLVAHSGKALSGCWMQVGCTHALVRESLFITVSLRHLLEDKGPMTSQLMQKLILTSGIFAHRANFKISSTWCFKAPACARIFKGNKPYMQMTTSPCGSLSISPPG